MYFLSLKDTNIDSTPADSKTGMTGGIFLGLQDFVLESVHANFRGVESAHSCADGARRGTGNETTPQTST